MQKIIRASKIRPAGGGTIAYRIVLVDLGESESAARYVVWDQGLPEGRPPYFGTGDYFEEKDVDAAHRRFEVRRDRLGLEEDPEHERSLAALTGQPF